jgi:hydrogenase nickel incorporation protein HypA/HybF
VHEVSIIQSLIEQIEGHMEEKGFHKVHRVTLDIGEMSGVVPDALEFAFDVCCQRTRIEGAKLTINYIPVRARCAGCDDEFTVKDSLFACSHCGHSDVEVLSGFELNLKEMEVD